MLDNGELPFRYVFFNGTYDNIVKFFYIFGENQSYQDACNEGKSRKLLVHEGRVNHSDRENSRLKCINLKFV